MYLPERHPARPGQRHADWIGMLQPDGLVVSVPVLDELDLYARQPQSAVAALREATEGDRLPDLATLARLLGWTDRFLTDAPPTCASTCPICRPPSAPPTSCATAASAPSC